MHNRFILTPYFLDEEWKGLEELALPSWHINRLKLNETDKIARMSSIHKSLAGYVFDALQEGERPVSVAGDCCTTIGVMAGLQRAELSPTLIWFDAHGDFNTGETTPSGFIGGMPLAMMAGRGDQRLVDAVGLEILPEEKIILVGARDLDPGEKTAIEHSSIRFMPDVRSLLDFPFPDLPLYVHFDTDVLNPRDAPAMSYRAEGGPFAEELREIFHFLHETGRTVAVSLSSWNPNLEGAGRSKGACMGLLRNLLGE